ncbi:hypothetical protein PAESOLCIP111_05161 [Paenibacillus solanacearum]|uniref:Peptidase M14 domain-containing protein n=1 Tax=Paenibacillus solanacearum TaxID=2048548 RepID=A0A916K611_9BACL|nr:M14 family zinc carboxypeptidase [Paenibacillus solanacearum]CAG7646407.1 hypothetical protein PAESOLCIP111_05161 [Paenibacillus solanacearum]
MDNIIIDCRHAGGNIKVTTVDGNRVRLEQDLRDTSKWWFYWNFSARSRQSQTVVFEFTNKEVVGPWGPAISRDGVNWDWLGSDSLISRESFSYDFREEDEKIFFSFSMPYQLHHFESFYSRFESHPQVRRKVLTISEQLRPVPLLLAGNGAHDRHIVFTCRHHACESTPSYLLEGLLGYYLEQPKSTVLDNYLIHYVPFVDIDGVENGDQGKNRAPHDHNRDYIDSPIYRSTAAIVNYVEPLRLLVGIDFHGPNKWGGRNDVPFFAKCYPPIKEETDILCEQLKILTMNLSHADDIVYDPIHDVEMGVAFNQPHGRSCSAFFERQQAKLVSIVEFPYFGTHHTAFTQQNCRKFGARFAQALESYLILQLDQ